MISANATFSSLANIQKAQINGLEVSVDTFLAGWYLNVDLTVLDHGNQNTNQELLRRPNQTLAVNVARKILTVILLSHVRPKRNQPKTLPLSASFVVTMLTSVARESCRMETANMR